MLSVGFLLLALLYSQSLLKCILAFLNHLIFILLHLIDESGFSVI